MSEIQHPAMPTVTSGIPDVQIPEFSTSTPPDQDLSSPPMELLSDAHSTQLSDSVPATRTDTTNSANMAAPLSMLHQTLASLQLTVAVLLQTSTKDKDITRPVYVTIGLSSRGTLIFYRHGQ